MVSYPIVLLLSAVASGSVRHIRSACGEYHLNTAKEESTYGGKSPEENDETKGIAQLYNQKSSPSAIRGGRTLSLKDQSAKLPIRFFSIPGETNSNGEPILFASYHPPTEPKKITNTGPSMMENGRDDSDQVQRRQRKVASNKRGRKTPPMPPRSIFKGTSAVLLHDSPTID